MDRQAPGPKKKGFDIREAFLSKDIDYLYAGVSLIMTVFYSIRIFKPILSGIVEPYAIIFNAYGIIIYALTAVLFFIRLPPRAFGAFKDHIIPFFSFVSPTLMILVGGLVTPMYSIPLASMVLFAIGCAIATASFIYLGKGFGVFPAIRQVATGGPYRAIRHPAYLGELLYLLGIVIHNVNWVSLVLFVVLTGATVGRIVIEERILSTAPEYREYRKRTRYRLIPGVW